MQTQTDTYVRMWQWQRTARIVNSKQPCQNVALGPSLTQGYQRASWWDKMCWVWKVDAPVVRGEMQAL